MFSDSSLKYKYMATHTGLIIPARKEENDLFVEQNCPVFPKMLTNCFKKRCQKTVSLVHRLSDFMSEFTCNCNPSTGVAAF